MPSDIERLLRELRGEIDRRDAEILGNLARQYDRMVFKPLRGDIDALTKLLEASKGSLIIQDTTEYKRLVEEAGAYLKKWQVYLDATVTNTAQNAIPLGQDAAEQLVRAAGLKGTFNTINPAAIEKLLDYLQDGSALYKRINSIAKAYTPEIADAIVQGVSIGKNPKAIADLLTKEFGMPLTDSLRTTRTVQIWSYRESSRAAYLANSDVVSGWIWYADLSSECCSACWAMHGSFHTNDETLDDHYNGRCTAIPLVVGAENEITSGEDEFNNLSEDEQRAIMGDAKYEAWSEGKFEFSAMSNQHDDEVYGSMRTETSVKDLLGE